MASIADRISVLDIWQRMEKLPMGRAAFTRLFQRMAPYFRTIPVSVESVAPGHAAASMRHVRRVHNHLGTVHAIALCNQAELIMGLVAEATVPKTHRWIPKAMRVAYLAKARGTMHGEARLELPEPMPERETFTVPVVVRDDSGETVFTADIDIWVTRKSSENR